MGVDAGIRRWARRRHVWGWGRRGCWLVRRGFLNAFWQQVGVIRCRFRCRGGRGRFLGSCWRFLRRSHCRGRERTASNQERCKEIAGP